MLWNVFISHSDLKQTPGSPTMPSLRGETRYRDPGLLQASTTTNCQIVLSLTFLTLTYPSFTFQSQLDLVEWGLHTHDLMPSVFQLKMKEWIKALKKMPVIKRALVIHC